MTTHYDNSGSEDGQLRSPGDYQFISGDDELDEHDGDSLDIKPPQATTHYSRDVAIREPKRRDKISKEKKHSKERRQHRDKSGGGIGSSGGGSDGGHERERERKPVAAPFRETRTEIERYQQRGGGGSGSGGGGYERNDGARYQKHYDRGRDNHALLHHHNQPAPMHMHRRQQDYYERPNDYHHHHHGNDYHSMRQPYNNSNKHYGQRVDYGHDMMEPVTSSNMQREREREREKERDRRKYSNSDGQQDAESLEQDLRSRLLSKRHKYVKEYEPATRKHHMELEDTQVYEEKERNERSYEEAHKERHSKSKRGKETRSKLVIEVFDSPDVTDLTYEKTTTQSQQHSKKHKRRDKDSKLPEAQPAAINVVEKHRSPEDSELVARRSKLLVAEREKARRKEQAREELEARREKRRERGAAEIIDELSPTAVAATVTAGLSALVKRHKSGTAEKRKKQSKKHKSKHSDYEEGEHEEDQEEDDDKDNDYDDSETDEQSEAESEHNVKMGKRRKNSVETLQHVKRKKLKNSKHQNDEQLTDDEDVEMAEEVTNSNSDSDAASERSYKKSKSKRKHSKKSADQNKKHRSKKQADQEEADDDDGDEVLKLPDSPLSIGELSKSPEKQRGRAKNIANDDNDDDDDDVDDADERTQSTRSRSHTRSHTESRSRSHTPHSSTHSSSRSRSRSRSRSLSHRRRRTISSSRSDSRSRSPRSRSSRSRSRTEEREMHANLRKSDAGEQQQHHQADGEKRKNTSTASSPTACDDKGTPLPNYFPGLQGCRSVEEFQCLNRIEEGTYGVVYRAKDKRTHEIVALKRLKMEKEKEGFPITSLREINTLLKGQHPNIVTVREIVVGSNMDKIFIVMDYVEHDLKSLMETMKTRKQCFLPGEVKCLTQQLLNAVGHLHDNWILHRDLKTSNLLLSHKGILKVGDFGLAREYGSPLKKYTSLVVTLWYRAPELLLCSPEYSTPVDIWSVGCIFAEFLQMAPLFPGKSEIDELNRIFKELGTPNDKIWPGYKDLPAVKNLLSQNSQFADYPVSNLRKRFHEKASETGIALLHGLLTYDPKQRLTADAALKHAFFKELPLPIDPSMFPTWPAKSELGARKALASSPKPPSGGSQFKQLGRDEPISNTSSTANKSNSSTGFSGIITGNKKTTANTGFVLNAGIEQRQVAMGPGFNLKF